LQYLHPTIVVDEKISPRFILVMGKESTVKNKYSLDTSFLDVDKDSGLDFFSKSKPKSIWV